ncbi:transporter substrate-binding domain-containing protein [Salinicola salarius]|uniref:transporter substrate-binding domain-containing protein n=1 Tax=Salinicola salarius TaxID=430457 RepID=UPI0023E3C2EA|nr:transporter substrate-binding domain-containing protein [Salinicola salarius]MDF3920536.1 transporter substrate-binding domain-containing protein [Salinicola salarius]
MNDDKSAVIEALAPEGRLRVAINYGNIVLAQRDGNGEPAGVSAALARALAAELGVEAEFATFDGAGDVFAAIDDDAWRIGFLARDPVRAEKIHFTAPYVIIEGTYLVPESSPFQDIDELDRSGVRIAVGKGAAYDLYLTRALQHASLVRAATSAAAIELFVESQLDAAAGVRQPLAAYAASNPGYRVLPGRFTAIEQCMAIPKTQASDAVTRYVEDFLARMKREGLVKRALSESGQDETQAAD